MQIVINVREDFLYEIKHKHPNMRTELEQSVLDGTVFPKGHGRLIDADALDRDLENAQVNLGDALSEAFDDGLTWASEVTSKLPTIIEADKAESEE